MEAGKPSQRSRRRYFPACEGLEVRELPSTTALLAANSLRIASQSASNAPSSSDPNKSWTIPLLYRPFVARFQGPIIVGAPRTADHQSQTFMYGGGNSSSFLHGDYQMAYFTPLDPATPTFGQAVLWDKNVSNTGSQIVLELTAVPGAVDRHGRPTQFTWTVSPSSGGTFSDSDGSGTAQVVYLSGRSGGQGRLRKAISSGKAGVIFHGTLGTTNLNNFTRTD